MKNHVLKIERKYFKEVENHNKTFEIRKNDRDFKEGDTVDLYEIDENGELTDEVLTASIGYVCDYAQQKGYVVFSLISKTAYDL